MPSLTQEKPLLMGARRLAQPMVQRPLRVCYLIDELATAGTETQLVELIRRLDRGKVQPYLCLLRGDSPMSRALEPADVPVLRLGIGSLRSTQSFSQAIRFLRFLRRERMDVVQIYFPDSTYFGLPLAWLARVPHRFRTRNNSGHWLTPLHRWLGRAMNVLTTGTLTNCNAARDSLVCEERMNPARVHILENGVDLDRFECIPVLRPDRKNQPFRIGIVANLRFVKGLDVLVDATAILAKQQVSFHLDIAGEGSEREALQHRIDAAGLTNRVVLRGQCTDVPGFLSQLDVAVLCSRSEGMPNAVLEYMAAGRSIVATRVGAVPELIDNGVHGLLVPPGDARALAAAIAQLSRDHSLACTCAAAARRRVASHFSRAAMIRRFENFYDRLPRR
jgi:L-malate glycosyltransferase